MEKSSQPASASAHAHTSTDHRRAFRLLGKTLFLALAAFTSWSLWHPAPHPSPSPYSAASPHPHPHPTPDFSHLATHCSPPPLPPSTYAARLRSLSHTLTALNASAYILEPGPNALYYANVSTAQWWLSERPLLLVVTPSADGAGKVSVVTPAFEATRAKLLPIPNKDGDAVPFLAWAEADSPYDAVLRALPADAQEGGTVFVDEMARLFVPAGLQAAAPGMSVRIAPAEVKALRERKTEEELAIMRCVNELTLLAIRDVRAHLHFGIRESAARALMTRALTQAGLTALDNLVLFGENAALPHGSGTDRVLGKEDFILIDCGGTMHGYKSDVTRTFALPGSTIPAAHLELWHNVQTAQQLALAAAKQGAPAMSVDAAARGWLARFALEGYFTHRLGHGIGLEVHESPYLLSSNAQPLAPGNAFSDEPGVYIEGRVGVRLEDCFYVADGGGPGVPFTLGVGGMARSPWDI